MDGGMLQLGESSSIPPIHSADAILSHVCGIKKNR